MTELDDDRVRAECERVLAQNRRQGETNGVRCALRRAYPTPLRVLTSSAPRTILR
jgi:hypothetical protein